MKYCIILQGEKSTKDFDFPVDKSSWDFQASCNEIPLSNSDWYNLYLCDFYLYLQFKKSGDLSAFCSVKYTDLGLHSFRVGSEWKRCSASAMYFISNYYVYFFLYNTYIQICCGTVSRCVHAYNITFLYFVGVQSILLLLSAAWEGPCVI